MLYLINNSFKRSIINSDAQLKIKGGNMTHAEQRIIGRLTLEADLIPSEVHELLYRAKIIASHSNGRSIGLLIHIIKFQGTAWTNGSNGDQVWFIIRDSKIITVMFRRSTQPDTCEALRVDRIVRNIH